MPISPAPARTPDLAGRHILVVEDEYLIAEAMVEILEEGGARVVGPVPTLQRALALVANGGRLDAAVLDINLQGQAAYPVADALRRAGVPFVFTTGYDEWVLAAPYATVPRLEKPVDPAALIEALAAQLPP